MVYAAYHEYANVCVCVHARARAYVRVCQRQKNFQPRIFARFFPHRLLLFILRICLNR